MTIFPLTRIGVLAFSFFLLVSSRGFAAQAYDEDAYGPEDSITWNTPVQASFSHKVHTMEAGLECADCHDDLFPQEANTTDPKDFTMKAMADGLFCGACHDGDSAFATDTSCGSCHTMSAESVTWKKPTEVNFNHKAHVEEFELSCTSCHDKVFPMKKNIAATRADFTMSAFKNGKYCGTCHNGDDAFDSSTQCESCHVPPERKIVFSQPVKSVVFEHKIHVDKAQLSCESCHKEVFIMGKKTVEDEKPISSENPAEKRKYLETIHARYCGTCHDSSQAFGYLTRCTVCHIGVKGLAAINGETGKNGSHENKKHEK
ncbi:hypothetical protein DGMP_05360 [Desulfomarina profundi]|uniref:Cytochrome c7-like domain-containing protein n=1 Tax=Desulfomarina profundi TaxID=2772557 RepID=A0A8D5FJ69_9BACT|nr:c(7)-type cytochrome triheme domain-containing protein [Desulfomarina profundi]BCL59843.1 hypothetical protein DGMP_05360 [Desulfomarina profundi]